MTLSDKYQIQLKEVFSVAKISSTSVREIIPEFFYPKFFEFGYDEMVLLCNVFKIFLSLYKKVVL